MKCHAVSVALLATVIAGCGHIDPTSPTPTTSRPDALNAIQ